MEYPTPKRTVNFSDRGRGFEDVVYNRHVIGILLITLFSYKMAFFRKPKAVPPCNIDKLYLYNEKLCFYVDLEAKAVSPKLHFPKELSKTKPFGLLNGDLYCLGETDIKTLDTHNHYIDTLTLLPSPMSTTIVDEKGFIYGITIDGEDSCLIKYITDTKAWKPIVPIPVKLCNPMLMKNKHFYILDGENSLFLQFDVDLLEWIRFPIPHYLLTGKIDWFIREGDIDVFGYEKQKFLCFAEELEEWILEAPIKKEISNEDHGQDAFTLQAVCYHPDINEVFGVSSKGQLYRIMYNDVSNNWKCCCILDAFDPQEDGDILGMFSSCANSE